MQTRQRKSPSREGEITLSNRFAELENEEGAQQAVTEGGRARKKKVAHPTRREPEF